jgi:hypothetical protein
MILDPTCSTVFIHFSKANNTFKFHDDDDNDDIVVIIHCTNLQNMKLKYNSARLLNLATALIV